MTAPLIRFQDASLGYGTGKVLEGVTCSVERGDLVGLVGPNGSGKTTFLRGALGLLRPARGVIELDASRRFAYVPQAEEMNLFWPVTIREVVSLAVRAKRTFGRWSPEDEGVVEEALARAGIAAIGERLLREVSGGQRQRAILAQALSQRPDVLLLDEPTRGLDVVAEMEFLDLIRDLNVREKMTILLVTHTLQVPLNLAGKILLFEKGKVIAATSKELVETRKLEEVYGVPFAHAEAQGLRWVAPLKKP